MLIPTALNNIIGSESVGSFSIINNLNTAQKHCLEKFINLCMKHGKKNKSFKIISNTLRRLCLSEATETFSKKQAKEARYASKPVLLTESTYCKQPCKQAFLPTTSKRSTIGVILLMNAIDNVKPIIEVKKVRISGTTQLVPSIIPKNRQICLAIRWIMEAAISRRNAKKSLTLEQCFFAELMDASQNIGAVRKRRDDLHKLAESNRGFAHYRWWDR